MRNLIRIADRSKEEVLKIYDLANKIEQGEFSQALKRKTIILFFPNSSIRTRVTFEKGIHSLGGQSILFPSDALDKKEEIKDVVGYLGDWADCLIVRHSSTNLMAEMKKYSKIPIINGMSSESHPCEVLSDLYAISKLKTDYLKLHYVFVGARGNIGNTWLEASKVMGFHLIQSCPSGHEIMGAPVEYDINKAIENCDIVLTDSISSVKEEFLPYQISEKLMQKATKGALLNPCPPFTRNEEVSADAIDSEYFVGYEFKKSLLYVQQAIILSCIFDELN